MSFVSVASPVESLFRGSTGIWDMLKTQENNETFAERRELLRRFDKVNFHINPLEFSSDKEFKKAMDELYEALTPFLIRYNRLLLYLPMHLIPDATQYHDSSDQTIAFCEAVIEAYFNLLDHRDLRADFIDGDIPEQCVPEKICQVVMMMETLKNKGFSSRLAYYQDHDGVVADSRRHITTKNPPPFKNPRRRNRSYPNDNLDVWAALEFNLRAFKEHRHSGSQNRLKWLRRDNDAKIVESLGSKLVEPLRGDYTPKHTTTNAARVYASGIRQYLEFTSRQSNYSVLQAFQKTAVPLFRLASIPEAREESSRALFVAHSLGLISKRILGSFGLRYPDLSGDFSKNFEASDHKKIRELVTDPDLHNLIYPVAVSFGSKLKGYSKPDSDLDIAVFLKPGVKSSPIMSEKFGDQVIEFHTEMVDDEIRIVDTDNSPSYVRSSLDCHILLNGVWFGDYNQIEYLGEKLVKPYLSDSRRNDDTWLWKMERDLLQYRLLHRGYARFNPTIDDVFMDRGYRLTASRLFMGKMIIP